MLRSSSRMGSLFTWRYGGKLSQQSCHSLPLAILALGACEVELHCLGQRSGVRRLECHATARASGRDSLLLPCLTLTRPPPGTPVLFGDTVQRRVDVQASASPGEPAEASLATSGAGLLDAHCDANQARSVRRSRKFRMFMLEGYTTQFCVRLFYLPTFPALARIEWSVRISGPSPISAPATSGMRAARPAFALLALLRPHSPRRARSVCSLARSTDEEDERFMRLALAQASLAFHAGEIPIGSVLVHKGECISAARNRVEELQDASAHAEMLCLRGGAQAQRSWRLMGTTLYVTVEPCPMCLAALHAFRVDRLVYGTVNPRLGAVESSMCCPTSAEHPYHTFEIAGGVMADEASELMKLFFRKRRNGEAEVEKPPEGKLPASEASAKDGSGATGSGEHERPR